MGRPGADLVPHLVHQARPARFLTMHTVTTPPLAAATRPRPATVTPHWAHALVHRLHTWVGLLIGPFLLIAALTGAAYVVTPQIEALVYQQALTTASTGPSLPLEQLIETARTHTGHALPLSGVRPAPAPGDTTRVMFNDPALGEGERRAIFLDPVTGAVLGDHAVYGTSGALPVRIWTSKLHRQLRLGEAGRLYSELAASWLWLAALGGLWMWCQRKRQPRPAPNARRPLRDRHGQLGLWLLAGMLFLSVSGLTWSRYAGEHIGQWRKAWGWGTPSLATALPGPAAASDSASGTPRSGTPAAHGHHHEAPPAHPAVTGSTNFDRVLQVARAHGIDAGKVEIRPPAAAHKAWTVTEIDRRWPTQVDAVAVDGETLAVVDHLRFADFPLAAQLTRWAVDLHMGVMFGLPNQLVLATVALGLVALVGWGYAMWWRRRALSHREPTLWQALGLAPWPARLAVLGLAVGLGLALPVLGVSLAVFLALDGVVSLRPSLRR